MSTVAESAVMLCESMVIQSVVIRGELTVIRCESMVASPR